MDIARCLINNSIYSAHTFSQLPEHARESMRVELICPNDECKGPAFFRRQSRSGQAACFGAHHIDNCSMAAAAPIRQQGAEGEERDYLLNRGDRLELDLNYGARRPVNIEATEGGGCAENWRRAARYTGDEARPNAVRRQRLQPLLRSLILHAGYAEQDISIEITGQDPIPAHQFFVPFDNAADTPIDNFYALWGLIASAKYSGDTLWLNAGGRANVSFPMDNDLQSTLQARLNVDKENLAEELHGCYLLVLGYLRRSIGNKKLYCTAESEAHIAVIRAQA